MPPETGNFFESPAQLPVLGGIEINILMPPETGNWLRDFAWLPPQLRSLIKSTYSSLPACVNLISLWNLISSWLCCGQKGSQVFKTWKKLSQVKIEFRMGFGWNYPFRVTLKLPVSGGIRMLFLMPPETGNFFESSAQLPVSGGIEINILMPPETGNWLRDLKSLNL